MLNTLIRLRLRAQARICPSFSLGRLLAAVGLAWCLGFSPSPSAWAGTPAPVRFFASPQPATEEEAPYAVSVNGAPAPLERAGALKPAWYFRFTASGPARVEVRLRRAGGAFHALKPERFFRDAARGGDTITFTMPAPGPVVLTVAESAAAEAWWPPLVALRERPQASPLDPQGRRVWRIAPLPATAHAGDLQTTAIQQALNECAAHPGGGVVCLEPGLHRAGTLRVGSHTELYLAAGALLEGSPRYADYPATGVGHVFLLFDHARGASLRGYGTIDGQGHLIRMGAQKNAKGERPGVRMIVPWRCQDLLIENVVARNPAFFNTHLLGCNGVVVRDLKILNDWGVLNTDGLDPHCCQDVLVERYFGLCGDDAIAIKASHQPEATQPNRNITIRDSVVMTLKTALKFGTGSRADSTRIRWENIDVINSSRGIGLWMQDGGRIHDVVFRDVRIDLREFEREISYGGEPLRISILPRPPHLAPGRVEDILFERVRFRFPWRALLEGHPASQIRNLTFRDCAWEVAPRRLRLKERVPLLDLRDSEAVRFENNTLAWPADPAQRALWMGVATQKRTRQVELTGLREPAQ